MIDGVDIAALKQKLQAQLQAQVLPSPWGPVVMAGGHQFRSLWVRDFCFSVPGLLVSGKHAEVMSCLDLIYKNRDQQKRVLVRGLDVCSPQWRVLAAVAGISLPDFSQGKKLIREFLGEHRTLAFDSNLLWILASLQADPKQQQWQEARRELLSFYEAYLVQGLLVQPAYSDWQDSARRSGTTFYLNLLYLKILFELSHPKFEKTRDLIFQKFFDPTSGLFLSQPEISRTQKSLETLLWSIEWDLFKNQISRQQLYQNLKNSEFFKTRVGVPVSEDYLAREISWTTKAAGLRHYHDRMIWSWLWAEQVRMAKLMQDEVTAKRLLEEFWISQPHKVFEIYQPVSPKLGKLEKLQPTRTWIYHSEEPFTWGLAKWTEALDGFR